ncbi:Piwi-domain-containing protein [Morchella conica CCBAS932]|uniref:Piwi-domain-containing protein n=1 Tax=Morchella conica CCBAS932 TaxID=1392247 RepID=A0A3N4KJM1_9PEZI|nr:Piwi-domain-containing protein [Morchella conica CCBAS932]
MPSFDAPPTAPRGMLPHQSTYSPPNTGINGLQTRPRAVLPHQSTFNPPNAGINAPTTATLPQRPRAVSSVPSNVSTSSIADSTHNPHYRAQSIPADSGYISAHGSHDPHGGNGINAAHSFQTLSVEDEANDARARARDFAGNRFNGQRNGQRSGRGSSHNIQRNQPQSVVRESRGAYDRGSYNRNDPAVGFDNRMDGRAHDMRRHRDGGAQDQRNNRGNRGDHSRDSRGNNNLAPRAVGVDVELPEQSSNAVNGKILKLPTRTSENNSCYSRITVFTNHFEVQSLPCIDIFQYDIRVTGDPRRSGGYLDESEIKQCSPSMVRKVMENPEIKSILGNGFVFDGVSIGWSTEKLPFPVDPFRYRLELPGSRPGRKFGCNIDISCTGKLSTDPFIKWLRNESCRTTSLDDVADFSKEEQIEICLKFLNALLRADPAKRFMSGHGNKSTAYFHRTPETTSGLTSSNRVLEAWRGFYQNIAVRFGKLTVNVDTITAAFIKPGIIFLDAICGLANINVLQPGDVYHADPQRLREIMRKFIGVGFQVKHIQEGPKKDLVRRVMRLTQHGASRETFSKRRFDKDPVTGEETVTMETISVEDYYRQQYNIILRFPQLPMVVCRKEGKYPLELCYVADGERWTEALKGKHTSDFTKFATAPPCVRKDQIAENVKVIGWNKQRVLKEFGVSVNPAFMQVEANVLKPVIPIYQTGTEYQGLKVPGRWNLGFKTFCKAQSVTQWGLMYFPGAPRTRRSDNELKRLTRMCCTEFRKYGLQMPPGPTITSVCDPQGDISRHILELLLKIQTQTKARPNLLVFLLECEQKDLYAQIKRICDTKLGIASQCMLANSAIKDDRDKSAGQYFGNIAMKVNIKLGGINALIEDPILNGRPTLVIGCEASYPNPSQLRLVPPPPAFVALSANYDLHCAQFSAVTDSQDPLDQKIVHFSPMAQELFTRYKKQTSREPERVIYFRDGLSEGGYGSELRTELEELKKLTNAPITVVLCIKRHHTRFFPGPGENGDRMGNIFPGTVVENGNGKDIFLVAHIALKGTVRPTRYVAVYDDNKLSAGQFQELCHNLCYGYGRATMAVSMVPPVYYARLACERARLHMENNVKLDDGSPGMSTLPQTHRNIQYSMWWQ